MALEPMAAKVITVATLLALRTQYCCPAAGTGIVIVQVVVHSKIAVGVVAENVLLDPGVVKLTAGRSVTAIARYVPRPAVALANSAWVVVVLVAARTTVESAATSGMVATRAAADVPVSRMLLVAAPPM